MEFNYTFAFPMGSGSRAMSFFLTLPTALRPGLGLWRA